MPAERLLYLEQNADRSGYSEAIRQRREQMGWTQQQLAEILELSGCVVSNWELGISAPKGRTLSRLTAVLECSGADLMGISKKDVCALVSEVRVLRAHLEFYESRLLKIKKLNPVMRSDFKSFWNRINPTENT